MAGEITLLDLRLRRRLIVGYAVGMAAYAGLVVALYPAFKDDTGLNQLTANGSAVAAVIGVSGTITSPAGWLNVNLYANFVPLVVLLATIGYGASCIAGQDDDRTLALLASMPVSRRSITVGKLIALLAQALPVPIVTALCVLGGRHFELSIAAGPLIGVTVGVTLLGLVFGTLGLLVGALTGSRGTALGVASAAAATAYLINSLAPSVHWLRPARYLSPFFYAVGDNQLQQGMPLAWVGVLSAATVVFALAAVFAFERLDVH